MPWIKLDDKLWSHPRVVEAGLEAFGLYIRLMIYCGDQLTDGIIKDSVVAMIQGSPVTIRTALVRAESARSPAVVPSGVRRLSNGQISESTSADCFASRETPVEKLIAVGLLARREEVPGVEILHYLDFQPSAKSVKEKRKSESERKARSRATASKPVREMSARSPRGVRPLSVSPDPDPDPINRTPLPPVAAEATEQAPPPARRVDSPPTARAVSKKKSVEDSAIGRYAKAFAKGIERHTHKPCTPPIDSGAQLAFRTLLPVHALLGGTKLTGDELLTWIESRAFDFARAVDPQFGGYTPRRMGQWLDTGAKSNGKQNALQPASTDAPWRQRANAQLRKGED